MFWCWNLYIWSFLDYFVFSSWLQISYFIVSVDSWNLEICQAWCPKWKKPTETSAVEVFVTVRYDLENCTIDDICWNFIASTTKMEKNQTIYLWDIFSWFTGACLNMYSFLSYVFPSKLTRRCFVLKMTVPMVPGFWSSGCIVAACQAGNVAMPGANAERFRVNGSDGRIRSAQWRWKNEKKQLLQDG